uniref:Uncharacterized protein n=1 Tax=Vibrio splendidus TaxID=29497 RepID=A0A0H3ZU31_VIBSP|nr:hypothetical protein [Vibrio splendidus]
MCNHESRIKKASCLEDLVGEASFGIPHRIGHLSLKVEDGFLVERRYTLSVDKKKK